MKCNLEKGMYNDFKWKDSSIDYCYFQKLAHYMNFNALIYRYFVKADW